MPYFPQLKLNDLSPRHFFRKNHTKLTLEDIRVKNHSRVNFVANLSLKCGHSRNTKGFTQEKNPINAKTVVRPLLTLRT